jgi:hypothetical protein
MKNLKMVKRTIHIYMILKDPEGRLITLYLMVLTMEILSCMMRVAQVEVRHNTRVTTIK